MMDSVMTLVEALEGHALRRPEKVSLIFHGQRMTYSELNEKVNRLANSLRKIVKEGDRVGVMLGRIPELVVSFLAVAKIRGILVPVNFELGEKGVHDVMEKIEPSCVIVAESVIGVVKKSVCSQSLPVVVVGDACGEYLSWYEMLDEGLSENPGVNVGIDDIVYLNFTSGSTGKSKGALARHSNIFWNTAAAIEALELGSDDVHLCMFAPFAHPHEIIARPIYLGGTMVLVENIYPKSLAEAVSENKVTCMMGLAPMYDNLLAVHSRGGYDLSSLRVAESGGMYTHPELIERFKEEVGAGIVPVWGSTETTGIAIANRVGIEGPEGSIGKVCKYYEVRVVDENGKDVAADEVGEMIFKGAGVVDGYHKDALNSVRCFRDGWYFSGDLGWCDEEGNFFFVGRKSEMMKVAGLKVHPLEIERVSMEHPGIKEAVVVAAIDRLRGEVPRAIVVAKEGVELKERELIAFWRKRLAHYKVPRVIHIREYLPRKSGSGKVDKSILKLESI